MADPELSEERRLVVPWELMKALYKIAENVKPEHHEDATNLWLTFYAIWNESEKVREESCGEPDE